MGSKISVPDYLKKTFKGTTVGGGVNVYEDEQVSVPRADLSISKGKTKINVGAEKPFLKKEKGNINSTLELGITRQGENSSFGIGIPVINVSPTNAHCSLMEVPSSSHPFTNKILPIS